MTKRIAIGRTCVLVPIVAVLSVASPTLAGGVIHVDADASPGGDGTSWASAYNDLQNALAAAGNGDEIWVAEGTYTPTEPGGDRAATFQLKNGVALYGGFAGDETSRSQRDSVAHETILSGDLNGDDGPDFANNDENVYHVVTDNTDGTILDGFTIKSGNADDAFPSIDGNGGELLNIFAGTTIANCVFKGNSAGFGGGMQGFYADGRSPTLSNCTFVENRANSFPEQGGGLYNADGPVKLINCTFTRNSARLGGAMMDQFTTGTHMVNCIFSGNTATESGGGIFNGLGGIITLINCSLSGNSAQTGGGIFYGSIWWDGRTTVTNCILWGNSDSFGTAESAQIKYSSRTPVVNYSVIQGLSGALGGVGNVGENPLLTPDLHLRAGSPCIDAGDPSFVPDADQPAGDGHPQQHLRNRGHSHWLWAPATDRGRRRDRGPERSERQGLCRFRKPGLGDDHC